MAAPKDKKTEKDKMSLREQIMHSTIASFKIEGINIPLDKALAALKQVELNLGKKNG
jgi:hypothetical protein